MPVVVVPAKVCHLRAAIGRVGSALRASATGMREVAGLNPASAIPTILKEKGSAGPPPDFLRVL